MFDQDSCLERLLARHDDAVVVEAVPGRPALIRRDELLVAPQDAPAVADLVRRWHDSGEDDHGVHRMRLRPAARVDVCELASQLAGDRRHRELAVAPNHLVHGQPLWWSGPADLARPTAPVPAPRPRPAARETTVAVLDTGLSPHPWYDGADWYAGQRDDVAEVLDADLDCALDAQAGHGTFITGVVLRYAPSARIRAVRVLGGDGVGDELDVVRALARLAAWGRADVVNLSLGCHTFDDRPSPVLSRVLAQLRSAPRRPVVVACAGNTGGERPFWPAAAKSVISVAALDTRRGRTDRAWFSNYGWWVDACAPGVDIASCFVRFGEFDGYARWSGTSFAAPAVAGMIAGLAAQEDVPAAEAARRVLDPARARTLPDLGVVVGPSARDEVQREPAGV
ncbi:S8 family serine peptidase [Actinomadura keratinilytica]|uniref:S8/S53 family peptidase n=1 Tax=Actinomadura keratinilytica TaxID=547461 RepID=A0ABP7YY99_9ACTN